MRPRTLAPDAWAEIERVALARAKLPTDVELAEKHGVSRSRIQQIMKAARDALVHTCAVSTEANSAHTSSPCPSDAQASPSVLSSVALPNPSANGASSPSSSND